MKLRTICFDLDNTLVDRDAACHRYWTLFIERHAPAFQADGPQRALERLLIKDCHGWTGRREFFTWVAATYPQLSQSPEQLWSDYWDELPRYITAYPGVPELLAWLQSRFQLALVSNGSSALQRSKLARCGLDGYFSAVFISGEIGVEKPDPEIFAQVARWSGDMPGEILFVGDDPARDIVGAHQAQFRTCWVTLEMAWQPDLPAPDWAVRVVTELPGLLGSIGIVSNNPTCIKDPIDHRL